MVKPDRLLMFHHHLEAFYKKLYKRVTLLRQLAGSGWGADAKPLCAAALSLVYSTAEYGAQVWSQVRSLILRKIIESLILRKTVVVSLIPHQDKIKFNP